MAASGKIELAILSRDARRLADEVERLHSDFVRTGALLRVRQYMALHSEGNPHFDMLDAAKALRSYAGILSPPDRPVTTSLAPRCLASAHRSDA